MFRTSTTLSMAPASGTAMSNGPLWPITGGAAAITGRSPRKRYGGLKISKLGSRLLFENPPGSVMTFEYSVGIGA